MKNFYRLTLLFLICVVPAYGQYITVWKTDNYGISSKNQIVIPATGTGYDIAWEEIGNPANNGVARGSGNYTLTFPAAGVYQVSILPGSGTFSRITFGPLTDLQKIIEIRQWGNIQWASMERAYSGCSNLSITAADIPDLRNVTSAQGMFASCPQLVSIPQINSWDMSTVTNMAFMFSGSGFNDPLDGWNVSNVTNMSHMFDNAQAFNQPIGNWNVSKVTDMSHMFVSAFAFNQPIGNWNVSNVANMSHMFDNAQSFSQPIANWNVSKATDMSYLFRRARSFNGSIDSWNVSSVINMQSLFEEAVVFDQPIGSWDVSNVTNMSGMFSMSSFDQPIGNWNVGNVTTMHMMFFQANSFNQPVNNWDVSNVTDLSYMFRDAVAFNQPVNSWNLSQATNLLGMFSSAQSFNQPVDNWDVSHVQLAMGIFSGASSFNQPLGSWTLSSAVDLSAIVQSSAMDCVNMTTTLQGWAANPASPRNVSFSAADINYGPPAVRALYVLTNFYNWDVLVGEEVECSPLEVSLISFDVRNAGGAVKLDWGTNSENDNDYFDVERSIDSRKWHSIGRIKGAGTINSAQHYSHTDSNPIDGTSYYRLKIVDIKGKADYSNIRVVKVKIAPVPSIYPNPATTSVTLSGKATGRISIHSSSGRQILQAELKTEKTVIPVEALPAGTYVVKSDEGWSSKFVKD